MAFSRSWAKPTRRCALMAAPAWRRARRPWMISSRRPLSGWPSCLSLLLGSALTFVCDTFTARKNRKNNEIINNITNISQNKNDDSDTVNMINNCNRINNMSAFQLMMSWVRALAHASPPSLLHAIIVWGQLQLSHVEFLRMQWFIVMHACSRFLRCCWANFIWYALTLRTVCCVCK